MFSPSLPQLPAIARLFEFHWFSFRMMCKLACLTYRLLTSITLLSAHVISLLYSFFTQ